MKQPVLLAPALKNLTELVDDKQKRENIHEAVDDYLSNPPNHTLWQDYWGYNPDMHSAALSDSLKKRDSKYPLIPGWNIIGMGIDASNMEFTVLPIVMLNTEENGTYQCSEDDQYGPSCWQNPYYPDHQFFVPQNIYLANTPNSVLVNGSQIFQAYDDFESYYSNNEGDDSFFGSSSKTVYHFYEKYFEEDSALTFVYQSRSWYQLTLPPLPPPSLNPKVAAVIEQLPPQYTPEDPENVRLYQNAIQSLGTHFVYSSMFGGTQQMVGWFHKCLLSTYSEDFVEEQSSWSFLGLIYGSSGSINYNMKLNENYVSWSDVTVQFIGGKAFEYEPGDFNEWVDSLKDRPLPTLYNVLPISFLIQDADRQNSYDQAVKDYMKQSYNTTSAASNYLSQKDPWTKPSWCQWTPPAPVDVPAH
jgi:hypothetical protein